jgi:hypothetical protein
VIEVFYRPISILGITDDPHDSKLVR